MLLGRLLLLLTPAHCELAQASLQSAMWMPHGDADQHTLHHYTPQIRHLGIHTAFFVVTVNEAC